MGFSTRTTATARRGRCGCSSVGKRNAQTLLGGDKAKGRDGEDGQPFLPMTPNASAHGPMIPAMETKVLTHTVAFVLVGSIVLGVFFGYLAFGVYFLTVLDGLQR